MEAPPKKIKIVTNYKAVIVQYGRFFGHANVGKNDTFGLMIGIQVAILRMAYELKDNLDTVIQDAGFNAVGEIFIAELDYDQFVEAGVVVGLGVAFAQAVENGGTFGIGKVLELVAKKYNFIDGVTLVK